VGYEYLPEKPPVPSNRKKKVLVIGGGPAGMEAAISARESGHDVVLYEKEEEVGGLVNLAARGPGRDRLGELIRFQRSALARLGVRVKTSINATKEQIIDLGFDAVIVATGAKASRSSIIGDYGPPFVMTVSELFDDRIEVGERILYIDENGGHHASASVEWLLDQGKKVDVVTSDLFVGIDLLPLGDLTLIRQTLLQKGCHFICDIRVKEIDKKIIKGRNIYSNEEITFEGYDNTVTDMGYQANDRLYKELKGEINELYRAGDCVSPRNIGMAVFEGRRAGEKL
jgi:thioredoxin reductase